MLGATSTSGQGGPLRLAFGDVGLDPRALLLGDERAHLAVGVKRVADPYFGEHAGQGVDHLVVTATGDNDSGQRVAGLACIDALICGQRGRGGGDVHVVEDDGGRFPSQLKVEAGHPLPTDRCDPPAGRGGSGKGNLVDPRVAHHQLGCFSVGRQHIKNARRQSDGFGDLGKHVALTR